MSEPTRTRNWREYFDSEYLTGDALDPEGSTFTIIEKTRVEVEDSGEKKHKLVLTFSDGNRWLTNITNCTFMEHMFGSKHPADWIGRKVTLQFDPTVRFGREVVGGIRVIGSPDIEKPVEFMFAETSRKRPRKVTLLPTKPGGTVSDEAIAFEGGPDDDIDEALGLDV